MNTMKSAAWWMVAGLAFGLGGCVMEETADEVELDENVGQSAGAIGDPALIFCSQGVHPSTPAGNRIITRNGQDNVVSSQPTQCAVMGLIGVNQGTNQAFEVVADQAMVQLGGTSGVMDCSLCQQLQGPPPPPPPGSGSAYGRFTTPTTVESIGLLGSYPFAVMPGYGIAWHWSNWSAPGASSMSTFCDSASSYGAPSYGPLTNPYGYELIDTGTSATWGSYAYQQYDATYGWIRAASVQVTTSSVYAKLRAVPRYDYCN